MLQVALNLFDAIEQKLYAWLTEKGLDLYSIDSTCEDLDSTSVDSLANIEQFETREGSIAGGLAERLGVGTMHWYFPDFDTSVVVPDSEDTTEETDPEERLAQQGQETTPGLGNVTGKNPGYSLYPNPTSGNFIVDCETEGGFVITAIDGRVIAEYKLKQGKNELELPAGIVSGVYLTRYEPVKGEPVIKKLIYR